METVFTRQHELLRGSRNVLLDYCETLAKEDFTKEVKDFGRGSIRNLLVHTVNTYLFWLDMFARGQRVLFTEADAVRDVAEARRLFTDTDAGVQQFMLVFRGEYETPITGEIKRKEVKATPVELFTNVLTHEFHHKGQILSISRHLGYIPPDTDVLR